MGYISTTVDWFSSHRRSNCSRGRNGRYYHIRTCMDWRVLHQTTLAQRGRYQIPFPYLFFNGEGGSGKSNTLERVVAPVFGNKAFPSVQQVSAFSLMSVCASSNVIPLFMEEHKPSTMGKLQVYWLCNFLRDSYGNHKGMRGRADQTTNV